MNSERAQTWIGGLIGAGVLLALVGVVIAVTAQPGTETYMADGAYDATFLDERETGNAAVAWLGVALCGIGGAALFIGLVGAGVALGRIASRGESITGR